MGSIRSVWSTPAAPRTSPNGRHQYLGGPDAIRQIINETGAECMVIAFSRMEDSVLAKWPASPTNAGCGYGSYPDVRRGRSTMPGSNMWGLPCRPCRTDPRGWQFAIKHVLDRFLAAIGLLVISPIFLVLMALVRLSSPGPVLFRQPRVGRDGRVFDCLKFRTMREPTDATADFKLKDGAAPGGVEGCRSAHDDRQIPAIDVAGRTASVDQRRQGRNESGRSASRAAGIRGALRDADSPVRRTTSGQGRG